MRKKILWSDETKIEPYGQNSKSAQTPCLANTIPKVKHGSGSIMLWGVSQQQGQGD
ncbi:hypothetical protein LDENG_00144810 [Lucifuga dentata]|nr:hypothetical protein LDENG_00144810 [Lucifuga dentata]